jgi:arylsulfatase A-like enzyme
LVHITLKIESERIENKKTMKLYMAIAAGKVTNEIVHEVDIFPTLASLTGAKVPSDLAVDGINMADFFLGKNPKSRREGFVVFVADDLRAVKWHDWKLHYAWQETKTSAVAKLVDLTRDPHEARQVFEPYNTWIQYPMVQLVSELQV